MTTPQNEKADVPGLLLGDFLFSSQPARHNEADARLVLRMAMTGESLSDLRSNLRNAYGPLMNLDTLMRLMTAKQDQGKTLFYSDAPSLGPDSSPSKGVHRNKQRLKEQSSGSSSNGQRRSNLIIRGSAGNFDKVSGRLASELIQGTSLFPVQNYFRAIHRLVGAFQQRKRPTRRNPFRSFASVSSNSDFATEDESKVVEENVIETVPLEIALRLLMKSKDKYSLVVNKNDVRQDAKTPVFCIKGVEMSLDTTEGPVTFMPMFFSKKELQKAFTVFREFLKKMWLANRVQKRTEICNRLMSSFSSLTGMDGVFSDARPSVRGSNEDVDEDDGLGNGDPPEIKEFIEEMGESGAADFMPPSSPSIMALPLILLFGCLTVSTALWKDCALITDLILLNSPLEPMMLGVPRKINAHPISLESCIENFSTYNIGKQSVRTTSDESVDEEGKICDRMEVINGFLEKPVRKLKSLKLLQLLVNGVWQLARLPRTTRASLAMVVDKGLHPASLPNIKQLRKEAHNVSLNTVIEVDRKQIESLERTNEQPQESTADTALDLRLAFNLRTAFGKI
eukprot:g1318.t1